MSWKSAIKGRAQAAVTSLRPAFSLHQVDWSRLVTLDFETYFDGEYTLKKLSTSEYIRDPRFKAQMVGIKVGAKATRVVPAARIKAELAKINWATHALLCHNTQFDGFILSHHFGVVPAYYFDTLSMARGLHSNEIGASLDEVAQFYCKGNKIPDVLDQTKGVRDWPKDVYVRAAEYCAQDVDLTFEIFKEMHAKFPADEMSLVHLTCRMFCDPVLKVDIPRVEKELARELAERKGKMYAAVDPAKYEDAKLLKGKEKLLIGEDREMLLIERVVGSSERFAELLRAEGIEPPVKLSDAWMKKSKEEREAADDKKWTYAFAKDDLDFVNLPQQFEIWGAGLTPEELAAKQQRLQDLVDVRLAVKSTTNITRAERFITAGRNGMSLPAGYAYFRAHTGRWGGNNKMNLQNLTRGGELRLSILAPRGHQIAVVDSGQIEARVNGWLWGQDDLMDAFRKADAWDKSKGMARGADRDAYCRFGDDVYGFEVTTEDKMERFVGKVCVLGLGFQMGAPKFQITLAKGALGGPPVYFELDRCHHIVNTYRRKNDAIVRGWDICKRIIEDMAVGREGAHKCISWERETIWLPNGMSLKYPDLKKRVNEKGWDEWTYKAGDQRSKIYGGLLCENIVQALARIIVGWQMYNINQKDRVVMTTHDEVVTCIKTAQADKAFARMMRWMTTAPAWCADIPLNAAGGWAHNYSK